MIGTRARSIVLPESWNENRTILFNCCHSPASSSPLHPYIIGDHRIFISVYTDYEQLYLIIRETARAKHGSSQPYNNIPPKGLRSRPCALITITLVQPYDSIRGRNDITYNPLLKSRIDTRYNDYTINIIFPPPTNN